MEGDGTNNQDGQATHAPDGTATLSQDATSSTAAPRPSSGPSAAPMFTSVIPELGHAPQESHTTLPPTMTATPASYPPTGRPINIRIPLPRTTRGQPSTGARRILRVERATGRVHLDTGRGTGNVVSVPLQQSGDAGISPIPIPIPTPTNTAADPAGTTVTTTQHGNVGVRVVQMNPLLPQPVPDSTVEMNIAADQQDSMSRFYCPICCEVMEVPVGCSSPACNSRFCLSCLSRVARDSRANQEPKCPICRVQFSDMVRDDELRMQMEEGMTLPCRHEGCPQQQLRLSKFRAHERTCEFAKVKCRFAPYGCPWKGRRNQVQSHEESDCALSRVKLLVEEIRRMKLDHSHRLDVLQQQTTGALHMLQVYRQTAQRDHIKCPTNLLDIFDYCQVITCSTKHFFENKHKWQALYGSKENQAAITNFLVLWPTIMMAARLSLVGFESLLNFCFPVDPKQPALDDTLLDNAILGLFLGIMTTSLVSIHFLNSRSSISWSAFNRSPLTTSSESIAAFAMWGVYVGIFEYLAEPVKSMLVWILLALVTACFPALVLTLSLWAARGVTAAPDPAASDLPGQARSLQSALFALRYCIVFHYFGGVNTLDAAIISNCLRPMFQRLSPHLVTHQCTLESMVSHLRKPYFGVRVALILVLSKDWNGGSTWDVVTFCWLLLEVVLATTLLVVATVTLSHSLKLGNVLGNMIVALSTVEAPQNSAMKDLNLIGPVCFGVWVCLQAMLHQFR